MSLQDWINCPEQNPMKNDYWKYLLKAFRKTIFIFSGMEGLSRAGNANLTGGLHADCVQRVGESCRKKITRTYMAPHYVFISSSCANNA
jgi:hypothetical protein